MTNYYFIFILFYFILPLREPREDNKVEAKRQSKDARTGWTAFVVGLGELLRIGIGGPLPERGYAPSSRDTGYCSGDERIEDDMIVI